MLTTWICVALVLQTLRVTRCQTLKWHPDNKFCESGIFVGEKIILEAILEPVGFDFNMSTQHTVVLERDKAMEIKCSMQIMQQGCMFTPLYCGYCMRSTTFIKMFFNVTAEETGKRHSFQLKYSRGNSTIATINTENIRINENENIARVFSKTAITFTWVFSSSGELIKEKNESDLLVCHDKWKVGAGISFVYGDDDKHRVALSRCVNLETFNHQAENVAFVYQDSCSRKLFQCRREDLISPNLQFTNPVITNVTNTTKTKMTWTSLASFNETFACYYGLEGTKDSVPGISKASNNSEAIAEGSSTYRHVCSLHFKSSDFYGSGSNSGLLQPAGKINYSRERAIACRVESVPSSMNIPRLGDNCPEGNGVFKGYIGLKSVASCICHVDFPGYPPRKVQWYNGEGHKIGKPGKSATLYIPSGPDDQNKTYTCKAMSHAGTDEYEVVFAPKFFEPPSATLLSCPEGKWVENGYIRIGTPAICTCKSSSANPLPGGGSMVQWLNSNGTKLLEAETIVPLTIPSRQKDINQKYKCRLTTPYEIEVEFSPKLVGPVVKLKVNNQSSTAIETGSNVTFSCEVESIFPANAVLVGRGRGQIKEDIRSQNQTLEFHLSNVTCDDCGRYECWGDDGVEFRTSESVQYVYVNCSLQRENGNRLLESYFNKQQKISIRIDVCGYPPMTNYTMVMKQGSTWTGVNRETYKVEFHYIENQFPSGILTVWINGKIGEEPTMYNLNVQNSVGKGVDIKFVVHTIKEQDKWLVIAVSVGSIASCTVLFICIVVTRRRILQAAQGTSRHQAPPQDPRTRPLPDPPEYEENPYSYYEEIPIDSDYIDPIDPPYDTETSV